MIVVKRCHTGACLQRDGATQTAEQQWRPPPNGPSVSFCCTSMSLAPQQPSSIVD